MPIPEDAPVMSAVDMAGERVETRPSAGVVDSIFTCGLSVVSPFYDVPPNLAPKLGALLSELGKGDSRDTGTGCPKTGCSATADRCRFSPKLHVGKSEVSGVISKGWVPWESVVRMAQRWGFCPVY